MKTLRFLFIAIGLIVLTIQLNGQLTATLTFDLSDLSIDTIDIYTQPSFAGCQFTEVIGAPHMPVIIKQYLLPKNAEIVSVSFSDTTYFTLPGSYLVYPTQTPIILDGRPAPPFVEPDSVYYSSNVRYNGEIIEIESLTNYSGFHMVRLKVFPLQYIASEQELTLFNSITFTINYQITGTDPLIKKMTMHQYQGMIDYQSKTVDNPEEIENLGSICDEIIPFYEGTRPLNLFFLPWAGGDVVEYIIITNDELKSSFEELAEWKMAKGIPALVVTTSQIEEYYPGFDLAEKLFNYLKDVCVNWGPEIYILLGGDTEIIPARITNCHDLAGFQVSDLYFSDVHKDNEPDYNWNQDEDGDFWDNDDALLDFIADNWLGRAPVKNIEEVNNFISKIKYYEQNNFSEMYANITLMAAYIGDCHDNTTGVIGMRDWMNPVYNLYIPNNFHNTTKRIYDYYNEWYGNLELTQSNALAALGGALVPEHIIAHIDHSGFNSIGTSQKCKNEYVSTTELDALAYTPGNIYKIFYSGGCDPNQFNKDCFAEHFINGTGIDNDHKGIGIGFIGNTGSGSGNSYNQCYQFFDHLYINPLFNLGKIFIETRIADFDSGPMQSLNFLGDPELPVWTASLSNLAIQVNPNTLTIGENQLEVTVNGLSSDDENAVVCIFKENEVYGVKKTITNQGVHRATFYCKTDTEGKGAFHILATAPNHLYAETSINVSGEPDVHLYIIGFDQPNLDLHRGENRFKIILKNAGISTATNIFSELSSLSEYVDINPLNHGNSYYDDIQNNSSRESRDEFKVIVLESAMDQLYIPFTLAIQSNEGQFVEEFFLQVKASQLDYRGNKITWTSENDNIFVEPGEDVFFKVELLNTGSQSVDISSATIEPVAINNIYYYTITNNEVSFNTIESFDTIWCIGEFRITMQNDLAMYNTFPVKLKIIDNFNKIYEFIIYINNTLTPDNADFYSDPSRITITCKPIAGAKGYNIYRLDPDSLPLGEDFEDSTYYKRLNLYVNQFPIYTDVNVEPCKVYYYKISYYCNDGLPQGPFTSALKAWTTIPSLEPWPIFLPDYGLRSEGSPILYNAIPLRENIDNPELEIFIPIDDGATEFASKSALYAFYSTGEELYNIDQNITAHAGFANFVNAGMKATPIIGEMNNEDAYGEVAFATTYGTPVMGDDVKKVFLYSAGHDPQDPDYPDKLWETLSPHGLGQAVKNALVGVKKIDGVNEDVKIIAAEMWHGELDVRNTSDGISYLSPSWPITVPYIPVPPPGTSESISFGLPVVADLNNDSFKEIIIGCSGSMGSHGVYVYDYDGSKYLELPGTFYIPQDTDNLVGLDCRPVVAELDQTDNNPEILLLSAYSDNKAHIFALNHDQSPVTNWGYDQHIIDISITDNGNYPALTVADLDYDGKLEVLIADAGKVYAWNANGELFNEYFPIEVEDLNCPYIAPLVANVDKDPENEIIIADPINNFIYAFNLDGSQVPGWPLAVNGLFSTPAIGDVDHDGLNEIVASYGGYVNVWKTEGETGHDQWPLYRLNSFNNAVYQEPACDYKPDEPFILPEDQTWNDYQIMDRDIFIPQNKTLTITGRVTMPDESKIVVERGGRLNLDGGVITTACSGLWQGIQVWGYKDKSQFDPEFPPGKVEVCGNAAIENARIAIATIKSVNGINENSYTGGIVWCKDSKFLNNIYGIRFYNYRNFNPYRPNTELDYASYIKNTTFITNGLLAEFGANPVAFIRMDDVVGINLRGNQFMNTCGDEYDWSRRGIGVESYNAAYFMNELCLNASIPCSLAKRNYFFNLYYGIKAYGQGRENRSTTVLNSDFHLNQNGMFVSIMNNARIDLNKFTVPERLPGDERPLYGLYIEYSSGYSIEENYFQGYDNGQDGNIGMYISNSGGKPNQVYKNDFSGLEYGMVAYGQNRNETGEGLCLKCNNFDLCMYDIHIIPETGLPHGLWLQGRNQGIAASQGTIGSDISPAGNTFTDQAELPQTFNYFNHQDCNLIDYYHHQTYPPGVIIKPYPRSEEMVHLTPVTAYYVNEDHACPSHLGGGGINLNMEKSLIISENEQVIVYYNSIQELKDGGDTYSLNFDVYTSTTDEANEIRQQLLDESPYLSDTVMKSAIYKENVLPIAMIRDVLVANPQSAKSSEILDKVNERLDPMPEEMLSEILEGRSYKGNLELLQDKLAAHQTEKYNSLRNLESYYKQDTLDFQGSQDSLISLWECEADPSVRYKLALLYLNMEDSLSCFSALNSIPQFNELSPDELVEFDHYWELVSLLWPLRNGTMNLDSLTANQLFALIESNSLPGALARNMLVAAGLTEYQEPIYLSNELKSSIIKPEYKGSVSENNRRLKIFPNPAKDYFILSYNLTGLQGNFNVEIINSEGKILIRQILDSTINQIVISTSLLPSSPYTLRLMNENSSIETLKFIILK